MEGGSGGQRRSSLLFHLNQAHTKISCLEDYIRDRERQFRSLAGNHQRSDSRSVGGVGTGGRLRRVGLSHNLLHMRSFLVDESEARSDGDDAEQYSRPLDGFGCLTVVRVAGHAPSSNISGDASIPFLLHRLVSREYHVGKGGVVIGTGPGCSVRLPSEADVEEHHVAIEWRSGEDDGCSGGCFVIRDMTEGKGTFYISRPPCSPTSDRSGREKVSSVDIILSDQVPIESLILGTEEVPTVDKDINKDGAHLPENQAHSNPPITRATTGLRFVLGQLEFSFTALPSDQLLILKMFDAARTGNLEELKVAVETGKSVEVQLPYISPSLAVDSMTHRGGARRTSVVSVVTTQGVDVNTEYQAPSYDDAHLFMPGFARRRSSAWRHGGGAVSSPDPVETGRPTSSEVRLLLHVAILQKHLDMTKYLLQQGADPNLRVGELKQSSLHLAALSNQPTIVRELLSHGADVEIMDNLHRQPLALTSNYMTRKLLVSTVLLCAAAEVGDYSEVVRLLSSTDISPNARGLRHKNALHLATAQGHTHVVQCLILNKADVNSRGGSRKRTPLHYASLHNQLDVAKLLLEAGANEFTRDAGGYTPLNLSNGGKMCTLLHKLPLSLCVAVQSGDVGVVRRVLSEMETEESSSGIGGVAEGIKTVDQRNEQSHAPLHLACTSGNLELVQLLVSHGASIDLRGGTDSWTPLMYAAMAGHSEVVQFLLDVGADSQEEDVQGNIVSSRVEQALEDTRDLIGQLDGTGRAQSLVETTLHTLEPPNLCRQESGSSCSLESEKTWLRNRAEKLKETLKVLTSGPDRLLKAIESKNYPEFEELLVSGVVDANIVLDKYAPSSALVRVCDHGLTNFAKTLITHGAQVNQVGTANQIPLLVAASNGNVELVKLLIGSGADVNLQCEDSRTSALHEAASANSMGCVQQLLGAGARLDLINGAGETPFQCSMLHDIKQLLAEGASRLLLAAQMGDSTEIRRLVMEEGLDASHTHHLGVTALHETSEYGHVDATRTLIDLSAEVNKQLHSSLMTPLHLASRNNHVEVATILASAGAKLDVKDEEGKVPFEVACSNQMRKVLVAARTVRASPIPSHEDSNKEMSCMICMDKPINTIILPCGHQAFCTTCVVKISHCALDRQAIREVITVFK